LLLNDDERQLVEAVIRPGNREENKMFESEGTQQKLYSEKDSKESA